MTFTGAGDFIAIGNKFFHKAVQECELSPNVNILDVGCGVGRMARPFASYLNNNGSYDGFDIVPSGIKWCKKHYRAFKNFHFHHVSLKNDLYNVASGINAAEFTFPFPHDHFDLAMVISVFTHMQEKDVQRYLHELWRVLKSGKYCVCTFFIVTKDPETNLQSNSSLSFKHEYENYFLHDKKVSDANVAFKWEALTNMISAAGFTIKTNLPGWWYNESQQHLSFDFQDVLILRKH